MQSRKSEDKSCRLTKARQNRDVGVEVRAASYSAVLANENMGAALRPLTDDGNEPSALGQLRFQRLRHGLDGAVDEDDIVRRAGAVAI